MTGRVVSMVEAPPQVMGASGPQRRTSSGVQSRVKSSRAMLLTSAMVPSYGPLYWVMKMEERE